MASSWTLRRWAKVVLPEEEGPAIITNFTFSRSAILAAISARRFSCSASWTRINRCICPAAMRSLSAPTFSRSMRFPQREDSVRVAKSFS